MKQSIGRLVLPLVVVFAAAVTVVMADPQAKGRYKKEGSACVWNANDTGPNQCTPVSEGRFKKDGDSCVWDAGARGADECKPKTGRFKKEGDKCVWNGSDSGPNQCDPRKAK